MKNKIYKWTKKGLARVDDTNINERLVFTQEKSALVYDLSTKEIIFLDFYKTKDSFIMLTDEILPTGLWISKKSSRQYPTTVLNIIHEQVPFEIIN